MNPLLHFIDYGWRERRWPHPAFDTGYYLERNPDIAAAGVNPLAHYLEYGGAERRNPSAQFDTAAYLARYPEAGAGGRNPRSMRCAARPSSPAARRTRPRRGLRARPLRSSAGAPRWPRSSAAAWWSTAPCPAHRDSGSITILEIIKALQGLGYAVTFIPFDLGHAERYANALEEAGIWCLASRELPSIDAFLQAHGALFDAVVLSRVTVACHLIDGVRSHCPRAALIFETMDLHYLRELRGAELGG